MTLTNQPSLPLPCVDAILELSETRIRCSRQVRAQEEYFVDHFSNFSVLPGVLQLEGLVQAASWWLRYQEGFTRSQVRMTACAQAKFVRLVRPETRIELEVELVAATDAGYRFKGQVLEKGEMAASARFGMTSEPLANSRPRFAGLEDELNAKYKILFNQLAEAGGLPTVR